MRKHILAALCCLMTCHILPAQEKTDATIYVDKSGVMRWSDTRREASFYGVNYTVPFAHAYRALGYLHIDRHEAIDRDVYHFARLGFNAYRIHIWDVEISDAEGNLQVNEHLELLDYLISRLKERNIRIVLTTMTNFGNGYPERNQPTEGFSYIYGKCDIHDNPEAQRVQQRYIAQLVQHVNPFTGKAYMNDPDIVGFEINNEPCHASTQAQTKAYIDGMLAALKQAGNRKPVFYNVSHNLQQSEAYYNTAIQGTTYQWYPVGLVAGRTRTGNFLPFVDDYAIPFDNVKGFASKAKLVYEYDPADNLAAYVHPAMVRTFRTAGFQWITQFAYDPIDMARFNTEYQTHYLNLAYTPQKALSIKIAAEAAYALPRNASYGAYPQDTVFGPFRVSYVDDLSELNTPEKFFYSNHTHTQPVAIDRLQAVAGYGNSPLVTYEGSGAYFLDRLEDGLWRLEVMPDAVPVSDPFAKPSLTKEVVAIQWGSWDMTLRLPQLGEAFTVTGLNDGNNFRTEATGNRISALRPGVYLLQRNGYTPAKTWTKDTRLATFRLGEYIAPAPSAGRFSVNHQPAAVVESARPLVIEAKVSGPSLPDSVILYTDKISFWNERNPHIRMQRTTGYTYRAEVPAAEVREGTFRYHILVCKDGQPVTFPADVDGSPLDWDYTAIAFFETRVVRPDAAISLLAPTDTYAGLESYIMPEWGRMQRRLLQDSPADRPSVQVTFDSSEPGSTPRFFLRKNVRDDLVNRVARAESCTTLCLELTETPDTLTVGFVTTTGYTYTTTVTAAPGILRIPLSALQQAPTALLPHPYPSFLQEYFNPVVSLPFRAGEIEQLEVSFAGAVKTPATIALGAVWME